NIFSTPDLLLSLRNADIFSITLNQYHAKAHIISIGAAWHLLCIGPGYITGCENYHKTKVNKKITAGYCKYDRDDQQETSEGRMLQSCRKFRNQSVDRCELF